MSLVRAIQQAVGTEATGDHLVEEVREAYRAKLKLDTLDHVLRHNYSLVWSLIEVDLQLIDEQTDQKLNERTLAHDRRNQGHHAPYQSRD